MLFLEQKRARDICIPALRAVAQPGNGTYPQRCIYGHRLREAFKILLQGFVSRALTPAE